MSVTRHSAGADLSAVSDGSHSDARSHPRASESTHTHTQSGSHTGVAAVASSTPAPPATTGHSEEYLLAGAIAGLISETVMHPIDTISHRAKVHPSSAYGGFAGAVRLIYWQEGIRGYFSGVSATVVASPPSTAVYFATYEWAKALGIRLTGGQYDAGVFFVAGAVSELAASLCFVPLEIVKSRLQLGENPHRATGGHVASQVNFRGITHALVGIYEEGGLQALTVGWKSGLIQDMLFSATQFFLYEQCKRFIRKTTGREMNTQETLAAGCVSGGIAAAITNPFDVVTSRLMAQDSRKTYGSDMTSVFRTTMQEGRIGLWRGTLPRVAQIAPLSALSFTVYEAMRRYLADTTLFRDNTVPQPPLR